MDGRPGVFEMMSVLEQEQNRASREIGSNIVRERENSC
jgi:hypothetical protein